MSACLIADLHAHYALHLVPGVRGAAKLASTAEGRDRLRDRLRAKLVGLASRFANYESFHSGPRVTVGSMRRGGVGVVLSALYSPFDEIDLKRSYGAPPARGYLETLLAQADLVEYDLANNHASTTALVRSPGDIEVARVERKVAFVHSVEGGFHLGATPRDVERAVERLARRGVAYITLAHLFWRRVATNAPALPFLPDWLYRLVFPQPQEGLTELGRAAVEAMCRERVLIDVTHMSERALEETLVRLDEPDPARRVPVIATHTGFRFGSQEYTLRAATIERLAARDGVIGLTMASHQILDGLSDRPNGLGESVDVLARHIDRITEITGSHRHVAIGSDFDGFVKPTLPGLGDMADMAALEDALAERYGDETAALIASQNALRPLREYWGGA